MQPDAPDRRRWSSHAASCSRGEHPDATAAAASGQVRVAQWEPKGVRQGQSPLVRPGIAPGIRQCPRIGISSGLHAPRTSARRSDASLYWPPPVRQRA
jgi:hypothetical protein